MQTADRTDSYQYCVFTYVFTQAWRMRSSAVTADRWTWQVQSSRFKVQYRWMDGRTKL